MAKADYPGIVNGAMWLRLTAIIVAVLAIAAGAASYMSLWRAIADRQADPAERWNELRIFAVQISGVVMGLMVAAAAFVLAGIGDAVREMAVNSRKR